MVSEKMLKALNRDASKVAAGMNLSELRDLLGHLDYLYYDQNTPLVADEVYDLVLDNYNSRSKKPYAKVGHRSSHPERDVKLPVPMGSLTKCKEGSTSHKRLLSSHGPFVISDKEDGISLELIYENFTLTHCYQRGDGITGSNTDGIIPSLSAPSTIPAENVIVRVEFTVNTSTFLRYMSSDNGGDYETARNGVGGLANRNKPSKLISRVKCVAHEILSGKGSNLRPSKQFALLKKWGFHVVPHVKYDRIDQEILSSHLARRKEAAKREIDGIVVAIDKPYTRAASGNPKHAFAYKENRLEDSVIVPVIGVEWRPSRYGKCTPRVVISPTTIGGVTVTYATGHNAYFIENGHKKVSGNKKPPHAPRPINKGAKLRIVRSGDVIPYIMEVVKPASTPAKPSFEVKRKGIDYYLVSGALGDSPEVRAQVFFFSHLKIDGIKAGTINDLHSRGLTDLKSIMYATRADFIECGLTSATATRLVRSIKDGIERASVVDLAVASGVFGSGIGTSKLTDVWSARSSAHLLKSSVLRSTLEDLPGFNTTIDTIVAGMKKFKIWYKDMELKPKPYKVHKAKSAKMKGIQVLFTSVRDESAKQWILDNGGSIAPSIKKANLVICKDSKSSNSKILAARTANIPVVTLEEFKKSTMK